VLFAGALLCGNSGPFSRLHHSVNMNHPNPCNQLDHYLLSNGFLPFDYLSQSSDESPDAPTSSNSGSYEYSCVEVRDPLSSSLMGQELPPLLLPSSPAGNVDSSVMLHPYHGPAAQFNVMSLVMPKTGPVNDNQPLPSYVPIALDTLGNPSPSRRLPEPESLRSSQDFCFHSPGIEKTSPFEIGLR
jgi:hypothetical protein